MARRKGEAREQITSTLRQDLLLQLREESSRTGIPMTKILDRAVESYLILIHSNNTPNF